METQGRVIVQVELKLKKDVQQQTMGGILIEKLWLCVLSVDNLPQCSKSPKKWLDAGWLSGPGSVSGWVPFRAIKRFTIKIRHYDTSLGRWVK